MGDPRVWKPLNALATASIIVVFLAATAHAAPVPIPPTARLPDLVNIIPIHIHVQESHQENDLLFTVGLGNIGAGPMELEPLADLRDETVLVDANQNIYDDLRASDGHVVESISLSKAFEFHEAHNHWHLTGSNSFAVFPAVDDGRGGVWSPVPVGSMVKESFCLIDYVPLDLPGLGRKEVGREYFDCFGTQGISVGWIDYYHHSTHDQFVRLTGAGAGIYYLVVEANPDRVFVESNYDNNVAWVSFALSYKGDNNAVVRVLYNSFDAVGEGILPPSKTNR